MDANEVILYVEDLPSAATFYSTVLGLAPTLEVAGMTEFDLDGMTLGLMPADDMRQLLFSPRLGSAACCELYLRRRDARLMLSRITNAGGPLLAPPAQRAWGEVVGYGTDPDGHGLAVAQW